MAASYRGNARSGVYQLQTTGYRAFVPAPLPPKPPVRIEGPLQALLSEADRALGRLEGSIQTLPNSDLFVFMYVRKEAVHSSQIEGTQSSLQDLLAAEARILSAHRPRDVDEVLNYVQAMNYGLKRLEALPVSVRLFKEIHQHLLEGVRGSHLTPGELRRSQNWIGAPGAALSEAVFVPPPPQLVGGSLQELEEFLHREDNIPPLVKIGLAHGQFETIHPFLDGNGRIGRLLITLLLCEKQMLAKPVLYLSHYFKRNRSEYYDRLQAVRDAGDWEGWIEFFLRGVAEVSGQAARTAGQILALREEHRSAISANLGRGAGNGLRLLETLYDRPIVSVQSVAEFLGVSYPAANVLVTRLCGAKILVEITGQARHRRFQYQPYLSLFEGGAP